MFFRTCCAVLVILVTTCVGVGQPQGDSKQTDRPDELRGQGKSDPQQRVDAQTRRLVRELKLDEAQAEQIREILRKEDEAFRELNVSESVPQQLRDQIQSVAREFGEAREAGDTERAKQLREQQLELGRKVRESGMAVREKVEALREISRAEILTILRNDQIESFNAYWEKNMSRGSGASSRARNPALLKRLVERLPDLTVGQKKQVDDLFKVHAIDAHTTGNVPRAPRARINKLFEDVYAVLTDKQKKVIQEKIERRPGSRTESRAQEPKKPDQPTAKSD